MRGDHRAHDRVVLKLAAPEDAVAEHDPATGNPAKDDPAQGAPGQSVPLTAAVLLLGWLLGGCSGVPMVEAPSANQSSRVQMLVLHFTSEHFGESLRLLTEPTAAPVSAHYLVPEPGDPHYPRDRLVVHRLVPEARRAWHAGHSVWDQRAAVNDGSIGIEIVNRSTCRDPEPPPPERMPELQHCNFLPYPDDQIDLVIALARDILARHPDIDTVDVVGHADVAPDRKVDPGPLFPWRRLHEAGIGPWYEADTVARLRADFERDGRPSVAALQRALRAWGHPVEVTGVEDAQSRFVVRAFQMRFRPRRHDGRLDVETAAILHALLERYRPEALTGLAAAGEGQSAAR